MYTEGIDNYGISSYYDSYGFEDAVCSDDTAYASEPATPHSLASINPPVAATPLTADFCAELEFNPLAEEILSMEESSEGLSAVLERMGYGTAEELLRDAVAAEGGTRELLSSQAVDAFSGIYDRLLILEDEYNFIPELADKVRVLREELRQRVNSLGIELGPEGQSITRDIQENLDSLEEYQPAQTVPESEPETCYTSSGLEFEYIQPPVNQTEEEVVVPTEEGLAITAEETEVVEQDTSEVDLSPPRPLLPYRPNNAAKRSVAPVARSTSPDSPWGIGEFQQGLAQMLNTFYVQVSARMDRAFRERQAGEVIRDPYETI